MKYDDNPKMNCYPECRVSITACSTSNRVAEDFICTCTYKVKIIFLHVICTIVVWLQDVFWAIQFSYILLSSHLCLSSNFFLFTVSSLFFLIHEKGDGFRVIYKYANDLNLYTYNHCVNERSFASYQRNHI